MSSLEKFFAKKIKLNIDGEEIIVDTLRTEEYAEIFEFRRLLEKGVWNEEDSQKLNELINRLVYNGLKENYPDLTIEDVKKLRVDITDKIIQARLQYTFPQIKFRGRIKAKITKKR